MTTASFGQSKYAIELIGGKTLNPDGMDGFLSDGISGGIGLSRSVDLHVEIVGNVIFSQYSHGTIKTWVDGRSNATDIIGPLSAGEDSYTCEISVGPRIRSRVLEFLSTYVLMQGGVYFIKTGTPSSAWGSPPVLLGATSAVQFLTLRESRDIQTRFFGCIGLGLRISPVDAFNVDLEAKIQVLARASLRSNSLVPLLASIQFPL